MPRQSITDLLSEADQAAPAAAPALPSRPAESGPAAVSPPEGRAATSRAARQPARAARTAGLTESRIPKWQRLERKELRLRADQLDELARLRRALNRQRGGAGERITENTLIRVAVDLLLARSGRLSGATEEELRESVTS